ncbi:hypothetical protein [Rhodococcus sp. DMU1]|uniref:hypothetical protein n=1 Tax=Rhodococcus sp. DMU1 TaxID=2722825 RepID=UPI00143EED41|nr:hypothetical protein [Rhodococcus sp. DMU1]QIX53684.1 hypothetical protein HFP48_29070 [Rhodococcus sp. DMU1]
MPSESSTPHQRQLKPVSALERYDLALIEHFARWLPFGGPSAQTVFEEFGISPATAYRRMLDLTEPNVLNRVPHERRGGLERVAAYRVTLARNLRTISRSQR